MKISIVIPVFNQWIYTKNCLESFKKLSNDYELIIVDNCSSDETQEGIKLFLNKTNYKYIRNDHNTGFGFACNQGYKAASSEYVMFLNNDIKVKDKELLWLDKMYEDLGKAPNSLIGPTGGFIDPKKNYEFQYETNDFNNKFNYMSGWCLTGSRANWDKLTLEGNEGPFDAKTYFAYFEDGDLSFRAKELGIEFKLYEVPMVHIGRQTSKTMNLSKMYLESKNKFLKKWAI